MERCQLDERIPLSPTLSACPKPNDSTLGSCDWVVYQHDAPVLAFCGHRGRNARLPPLARFIVLGREASEDASKNKPTVNNPLVVLKQPVLPFKLPLALRIANHPTGLAAAPKYWSDLARMQQRFGPVWASTWMPPSLACLINPTLVLEEDLEDVLSVFPHDQRPPIVLDAFDENEIIWTDEDVAKAFKALATHTSVTKVPVTIIFGPRWPSYHADALSAIGIVSSANQPSNAFLTFARHSDLNKIYVLQGQRVLDSVTAELGRYSINRSKPKAGDAFSFIVPAHGNQKNDFDVTLLSSTRVRINCESGVNVADRKYLAVELANAVAKSA